MSRVTERHIDDDESATMRPALSDRPLERKTREVLPLTRSEGSMGGPVSRWHTARSASDSALARLVSTSASRKSAQLTSRTGVITLYTVLEKNSRVSCTKWQLTAQRWCPKLATRLLNSSRPRSHCGSGKACRATLINVP